MEKLYFIEFKNTLNPSQREYQFFDCHDNARSMNDKLNRMLNEIQWKWKIARSAVEIERIIPL